MSPSLPFVEWLGPNVSGAVVIALFATVDLVALSLVILHMLLVITSPSYSRRMASDKERTYLTSARGLYLVCLFVGNLITALGGVLEFAWAAAQEIDEGFTCTSQAFLLQLGGNATALWLGIISMSALSTFMFNARPLRTRVALLTIAILWAAMVALDAAASGIFAESSNQFFYGIAGLWCWITPSHRLARLFLQYIWVWIWSLISAVCFLVVFFSVRGNILVKLHGRGKQIKWRKDSSDWSWLTEDYEGIVGTVGKTMCWFPIAYITLTVPMSVSRIAETFGFPVPVFAFVFSAVDIMLLGIVNSAIYLALRHSLSRISTSSSEDNLWGGRPEDKVTTDSFEALQEKKSIPWTPLPASKELVPPSPSQGQYQATSRPASTVAYAVTSGGDGMNRLSVLGDLPPRQVPVSAKLAQRSRSFHRPMESIGTDSSFSTLFNHGSQASAVNEASKPKLTLPPPALIASSRPSPATNIVSPSELSRLTSSPLTPQGPGPRAISPDLNSLLEGIPAAVPAGPPPPPRKQKRASPPSVPIDVDESDIGSFSARPSVDEFDRDKIRPVSMGDITTRVGLKREDSMRSLWTAHDPHEQMSPKSPEMHGNSTSKSRDTMHTFWAAYEASSPRSPEMPADQLRRDTMRTFWAAYEEPRTPHLPAPEETIVVGSEIEKPLKSGMVRPSISAVARAPVPVRTATPSQSSRPSSPRPPAPPLKDAMPPISAAGSLQLPPQARRSVSPKPPPTAALPAVPGMLRPATSAIARYGSPGLTIRDGPSSHRPMPSDASLTSETSWRVPRHQPGYL